MDTTVKIDAKKRDTLKIIASVEKRDIKNILGELIDDYIESHKETLEILSRPDWMDAIARGEKQIAKGEKVLWKDLQKTSGK